jgi:carboxypeptidase Taq
MYSKYVNYLETSYDIRSALAVLHWDMETQMPDGGATLRGRQLATLSSIIHERATSKEYQNILEQLAGVDSLSNEQQRNVSDSYKDLKKSLKYSAEFVHRESLLENKGVQSWKNAKKNNDFKSYAKDLENIINLRKEEADILGYEGHIYNAFIDKFEPETTVADLDIVFSGIKENLKPLMDKIIEKQKPSLGFIHAEFDEDKQWDFGLMLLRQMGYDFNHGRQDKSAHPFSTSFGVEDCRITTRVTKDNFFEMISSCVHEGGHALYERGLSSKHYGLPQGRSNSLGIHESQSRFWEKNIGMSKSYWKLNFPKIQNEFKDQLGNISFDEFYSSINHVSPSLIRTGADEVSYHFHVLIRYEIEKMILTDQVKVMELPELWNSLYKKYLGVDVPSDSMGVMQDVHWSDGSFGYFPTYSLGSFYAAQWHSKIKDQTENFEDKIQSGNFEFVRQWLSKNIYSAGRIYSPKEIAINATGEELNVDYYLDYIKGKYQV